jgi:hypothetical protein
MCLACALFVNHWQAERLPDNAIADPQMSLLLSGKRLAWRF